MGEKGNVVDAAAVAPGQQTTLVDRAGDVASATVTIAASQARNQIVDAAVDHAIDEARDRLREHRQQDDSTPEPPAQ